VFDLVFAVLTEQSSQLLEHKSRWHIGSTYGARLEQRLNLAACRYKSFRRKHFHCSLICVNMLQKVMRDMEALYYIDLSST
jgi:hypothetical protein